MGGKRREDKRKKDKCENIILPRQYCFKFQDSKMNHVR